MNTVFKMATSTHALFPIIPGVLGAKVNPDTWIRGSNTCEWDPSKPTFFLFYSQEISLAWSEVVELVPKRDELLSNEKDRQERILCNFWGQKHSSSDFSFVNDNFSLATLT